MRYYAFTIGLLAFLGACTQAKNTTSQALDDVQSGTSETVHKVRQELDLETPPPPKYKPVQPRYCYQTYQDIVCYGSPLVGQEARLVAYQNNKSTGYVIDPPPAPLVLKKPVTQTVTPAPTPAPAADTSGNPDKNLKEITFDPSELEPKKLVPDTKQQ